MWKLFGNKLAYEYPPIRPGKKPVLNLVSEPKHVFHIRGECYTAVFLDPRGESPLVIDARFRSTQPIRDEKYRVLFRSVFEGTFGSLFNFTQTFYRPKPGMRHEEPDISNYKNLLKALRPFFEKHEILRRVALKLRPSWHNRLWANQPTRIHTLTQVLYRVSLDLADEFRSIEFSSSQLSGIARLDEFRDLVWEECLKLRQARKEKWVSDHS